jgi:hypothetical protein
VKPPPTAQVQAVPGAVHQAIQRVIARAVARTRPQTDIDPNDGVAADTPRATIRLLGSVSHAATTPTDVITPTRTPSAIVQLQDDQASDQVSCRLAGWSPVKISDCEAGITGHLAPMARGRVERPDVALE